MECHHGFHHCKNYHTWILWVIRIPMNQPGLGPFLLGLLSSLVCWISSASSPRPKARGEDRWGFVVVNEIRSGWARNSGGGYTSHTYLYTYTLQGTNISPENGILKMIFLFPRWDMLIPWRVYPYESRPLPKFVGLMSLNPISAMGL